MAGSVRWGLGVLSALGMIWAPRAQAGVIESVVLDWHQHIEKCEADEGWLDRGAAVHVAMFDAVNAIAGRYQPYSAGLNAAPDSDMTVAAATAAHDVLVALCPGEAEVFEGALKKTVDAVASKTARDGGAEIGRRAAAAVLAARKDAGAEHLDPLFEPSSPGAYVPTVPRVGVNTARVRPWVLKMPEELRPPPPPALDSTTWAAYFNEIKRLGGKKSPDRTPVQTDIGKFWARDVREVLPQLLDRPGRDVVDDARFMALAEMAWSDSYVSMMDGKYAYMFWRPITAIRLADRDGNEATSPDAKWRPLLDGTPPHPEYPCGHCMSAAALGAVIAEEFGSTAPPIVLVDEDTMLRRFDTPQEFVDEVSLARLYGGVHYRFSINAGRDMGDKIGRFAVERYFRRLPPSR